MTPDSHPHPRQVVVVGGGIAGLTAAYRLRQNAREAEAELRITLIEAEDRLGGKIRTEHLDGLTIEAGPDSFLAQKPAALQLCQELGLGEQVTGTSEAGGGTYILRNGRLEPLPEGITMLVPTKFGPLLRSRLLSPRGKARLALDLLIPARRDGGDESVAAFVRRRLGSEAFERMAQPLLSGIYAGDAEQLSILATFPRLRETERKYGSLTRGMLAQRRQARSAPTPTPAHPNGRAPRRTPFLSLREGLGQLTGALAAALDEVDVRLGTSAVGLGRSEAGYRVALSDGSTLDAEAVMLATPAYAAADLTAGLDAELAATLREIPYVSTATITLVYRAADIDQRVTGRGFVIPRVENRELTAVTWVTNKFAGRAPADRAMVRAFVGRAGREGAVDLPDDLLLRLVRDELRAILRLTAEPEVARIYRWHDALPQYVLGHTERLALIDRKLTQLPGIYLLGAAYRGVGIPDCIQSAQVAADLAMRQLGGAERAVDMGVATLTHGDPRPSPARARERR